MLKHRFIQKTCHEFKLKSANQINHLYFYIYSKCAVFKTDVVGLTGSCYFTAEDDMGWGEVAVFIIHEENYLQNSPRIEI